MLGKNPIKIPNANNEEIIFIIKTVLSPSPYPVPPTVMQQPPTSWRMKDWHKAIITGSIIGGVLLISAVFVRSYIVQHLSGTTSSSIENKDTEDKNTIATSLTPIPAFRLILALIKLI